MNEQAPSPIQSAVKPGLTIGLVTLVLSYLAYFIDSSYLASGYFGLVVLVLFFALIIYFGKEYRNELGGFMSFGTAFNFSFFTILISGLIGLVGSILLFHVIDPSLPQVLGEITFESQLEMMEKFGASEAQVEETVKRMQAEPKITSFKQVFLGLGLAIVFNFVKALILSIIIKKNEEVPDQI